MCKHSILQSVVSKIRKSWSRELKLLTDEEIKWGEKKQKQDRKTGREMSQQNNEVIRSSLSSHYSEKLKIKKSQLAVLKITVTLKQFHLKIAQQ